MITMSSNFYRKVFIGQIKENLKDEDVKSVVIKTIMKSHIFGIITGIQKFSRKTIYSVDDGTGTLDCVLWHNESASTNRIGRCLSKLNSENAAHNSDSDELCREFLNKVQVNEEEFDYIHGDRISCLGLVKLVKGKLLMDVNHQCKAENMNAESLWILDVLFCHKHLK